jgi:hypothetical protein
MPAFHIGEYYQQVAVEPSSQGPRAPWFASESQLPLSESTSQSFDELGLVLWLLPRHSSIDSKNRQSLKAVDFAHGNVER